MIREMSQTLSLSIPGPGLERLGEIRGHFGAEIKGAGRQGDRCHALPGGRVVELPVTSTQLENQKVL